MEGTCWEIQANNLEHRGRLRPGVREGEKRKEVRKDFLKRLSKWMNSKVGHVQPYFMHTFLHMCKLAAKK